MTEQLTYVLETPIWVKHTPARLAHDILEHNRATKFTIVLAIGPPGTGKSSGDTTVLHSVHTKDENYDLHFYKKDDFKDIGKTLEALPKYRDCILTFDDVSYVMDELTPDEVSKILHRLSIVRETLDPERKETRCIVFLIFHYSFAIPKGLRAQANFRIQFAITDEERENYNKIMGYHNRKRILRYARKYISMMRYGNFTLPAPRGFKDKDGNPLKKLRYTRDKPFRIALVSNLGELHYMLYHKTSCAKCANRPKARVDPVLLADLVSQEGLSRVYKNAKYLAHFRSSKAVLPHADRRVLKHLDGLYKDRGIDPNDIVDLLKQVRREPRGERGGYFAKKLKALEELTVEEQKKVEEMASKIDENALAGDETTIDLERADEDEEESSYDDPASIFKGEWWKNG